MPKRSCLPSSEASHTTRVLHLRLKDRHAPTLLTMAADVNFVWNYCNELSFKVWERERRFMSGFDFSPYTRGASKEGLSIGSAVFQEVSEEFAKKRRAAKRVKLRWRVSRGTRRSLGWIPFKARSLSYKAGQVSFQGMKLSLWDSYGLADYELGAGNLCEDSRGRWYLNVCVKVRKETLLRPAAEVKVDAVGIDLGLKDLLTTSEGEFVPAQGFYRGLEPRLAVAQRAGRKCRVRAINVKISNRRKDHLHKLSTDLVRTHQAVFVGNVNAQALTRPSPSWTPGGASFEPCCSTSAMTQACGSRRLTRSSPPRSAAPVARAPDRRAWQA
ncbi:RNA-guided endonuclease InsQ/TnpB family protein [Hydrogenophaga sp. BPS33]|uniref:RNA-guided endonuclease InsQ/TnpB family protein n=1 Tax=Hydrogenophaga sp. BPS33 TaxID=2651974 RepID=UPI001F4816DF|nr:transposase [Hydrogenophaga sp. BPS33]